jgi:hypothetical protein
MIIGYTSMFSQTRQQLLRERHLMRVLHTAERRTKCSSVQCNGSYMDVLQPGAKQHPY